MNEQSREVSQSIVELIRLHDYVLARVFALQAVLQDLGLCSASEVQERTDQFSKKFGADLESRLAELLQKTESADQIPRLRWVR